MMRQMALSSLKLVAYIKDGDPIERMVSRLTRSTAKEVDMLRKFGLELDDMAVAILIWLCTLPLIGILIVPFFGWQAGLVAAAVLFILAMIVCWGICGRNFLKKKT